MSTKVPQTLFRQEVLDAKRTRSLGGISLALPVRVWLLTVFAAIAALTILLMLIFGTYTRRSHVAGQLVPIQGMATVLAPTTGVVTRVAAPEGGRVKAGQTIAVVTVPHATVHGGETSKALQAALERRTAGVEATRAARQEQFDAQADGLSGQLRVAQRELAQIEAEIVTRQEQVRLAKETLEPLQQLRSERYVSELQLKQQQTAVLEKMAEVQTLQRQAIASRRLIAQLQQTIRELPGQREASEAGVRRDLALLEQEQLETLARGEFAITAPVDGVVALQLFKLGQAVQAGQPLMHVLPGDGALEAELWVPSRAIGFIEPGDKVLLRYQAYPYQKFGHHQGRVARISRSTVDPHAPNGRDVASEPFYRIRVALDRQAITAYGKSEFLEPGMALDADVLGERRTLMEWVLEPIYSIRGTVFGR